MLIGDKEERPMATEKERIAVIKAVPYAIPGGAIREVSAILSSWVDPFHTKLQTFCGEYIETKFAKLEFRFTLQLQNDDPATAVAS